MPRPRTDRAGLVEYFRGVWDELKKVVWPGREELLRMTGIVVATVVLFALLIGGADYILSLGVRQLYTTSGSTTTTTSNSNLVPQTTTSPTQSPTQAPATSAASPQASSHATPLP
ncbi:MAG: preprotein translocase subunit SecE [Candidatus Dormibacteraeota bacterium]|nr:preprotein translocase subunit SecE [Candidatus Dormibacteraeota bacterium]MBV9524185.1 preprotein translocase subunit SecE [Candidatus Dormibacteraeota bacterium]